MVSDETKNQNKGKCIVFTGGGSVGHVTVNLSLIPLFVEAGWQIHYIGSHTGIEKDLICGLGNATYHAISTGKLRRFFAVKNISDIFKVIAGCIESKRLIKVIRPDVIFSKGGYVAFPVVYGGAKNHVPIIIHESDYTPGLANRLSARYADTICLTFDNELHRKKSSIETIYVGPIVRPDIFSGSREQGMEYCGFTSGKPVVLVVGGSLGSEHINKAVRAQIDAMLADFQIIHICGKNNVDQSIVKKGYRQFEYVKEEYPNFLAASDIVISRAGSNAIFEFFALCKPMLLIPLDRGGRGDQVENAGNFAQKGYARVLKDSDCIGNIFKETQLVYDLRDKYITAMKANSLRHDTLKRIFDIIVDHSQVFQHNSASSRW